MSLYQQLVDLSAQQLEAFKCGDVCRMQLLMVERGALIATLPPAAEAEQALLQQAVAADRELADALRSRMLELRASAAQVQRRRTNLNGYRQGTPASAQLLNFVL